LQIVHDYRTLHTIPELDRILPKTIAYIQSCLLPLNCSVFMPAEGAVCAYFDFGRKTTLAFRADMDGLPIQEQTGLLWQSQHPGVMHACGHDGHMAILLELARKIHKTRELAHNILLIFQPAEETDGGAQGICQSGILLQYGVCAIFGLHLWPGLPRGQFFSRSGAVMSGSCGVTVAFSGRSVHIANAELGIDALSACCRFLCQTEHLPIPHSYRLKFGKIYGGTASNVLCDRAELQGSLRTFSERDCRKIQCILNDLCSILSRQTGCRGRVTFSDGYPAVYNDRVLWERIQKKCAVKELSSTFWTAEDFSFYQKQVPGVYFLLGIGDAPPLHSPDFSFDEGVLSTGADFFLHLCQAL